MIIPQISTFHTDYFICFVYVTKQLLFIHTEHEGRRSFTFQETFCLFDLWFYVAVNNYGHVETVN